MFALSCIGSSRTRFSALPTALFTALLTVATTLVVSPAAAQDDVPVDIPADGPDEEQFTEAHTTPSVNVEPAPIRPYAAPDEPHVVITGGGWGHGVGMSQYGAYGRAEAGQNYRQILQAYYTGIDITATDFGGDIEVHLIKTGAVTFRPEGPIALKGGQTTIAEAENGDTVRIARADGAYVIRVNDKSVCGGDQQPVCPKNQMGVQARGNGRVPVGVAETGNRYQYGRFRLRAATGGNIDLSVASMSVEEYLYGLGEMPASWPLDALQAQALAGRTFAVRLIQSRRGNWSHPWDLWS
ncbi:MAG: hypothetical protein HKN26_00455, partial [Acidimicrobiales bacterium]|nr:hypothetical protein [Acidimicrobiales bacterium]